MKFSFSSKKEKRTSPKPGFCFKINVAVFQKSKTKFQGSIIYTKTIPPTISILLFLSAILFAQDLKTSCSGISGGEIFARSGYPCPIVISLEQASGEREVQLKLEDTKGNNLTTQKKVLLAKTSKKRLILYLTPFSLPTYFKVTVSAKGQKTFQKKLLIKPLLNPKAPFYLCYSGRPHLFQFFNQSKVRPFLPPLDPDVATPLPLTCQNTKFFLSQPEGYEQAQAIVFEDTQERFLLSSHREALKEWILRGGHFIFCFTDTTTLNAKDSLIYDLLGWDIGKLHKIETLADSPFFDSLKPGVSFIHEVSGYLPADIKLEYQNHPIVLSRSYGAGQISLITLDIGRKPLSKWHNRHKLVWLLQKQHRPFFFKTNPTFEKFLNQSLSQISNAGQLYILFFYLVLVLITFGPLNTFFLKKHPKKGFRIVLLLLVFLCLFAQITQLRWKRTPETQIQIDFSYYWEGKGVQYSFLSLFSFEGRKKTVTWEEPVFPYYWRVTHKDPVPLDLNAPQHGSLVQVKPPQLKEIQFTPWGWRYFQANRSIKIQEELPISYSVRLEGSTLTGQLINHTNKNFEAILFIQKSPLKQLTHSNPKKTYRPLITILGPLKAYGVSAFKKVPLSISVPEEWRTLLAKLEACSYSIEIDEFFGSLEPQRGNTLLIGITKVEHHSGKHHYSYYFVEGKE